MDARGRDRLTESKRLYVICSLLRTATGSLFLCRQYVAWFKGLNERGELFCFNLYSTINTVYYCYYYYCYFYKLVEMWLVMHFNNVVQ